MCPGCNQEHSIPVTTDEKEERAWLWNRDANKPTIVPSLLVNVEGRNPTSPICHSFITDGEIRFLNDCTHAMAGQTVEIPEIKITK